MENDAVGNGEMGINRPTWGWAFVLLVGAWQNSDNTLLNDLFSFIDDADKHNYSVIEPSKTFFFTLYLNCWSHERRSLQKNYWEITGHENATN
jgi:hypothetical protein